MADDEKILEDALRRVETIAPERATPAVRRLRRPEGRWVRLPLGLALTVGGIFSFLPVLGIWMLPLGLILVATDVPVLRRPVARLVLAATRRWKTLQRRRARR
ncbi:hypothetical protein [Salinarimonas sp.]|uniref:hypothetical protein n=1 Tax=Salinarimonas sp. TaxID=2766526 RepID=UPI0032D8BEC8